MHATPVLNVRFQAQARLTPIPDPTAPDTGIDRTTDVPRADSTGHKDLMRRRIRTCKELLGLWTPTPGFRFVGDVGMANLRQNKGFIAFKDGRIWKLDGDALPDHPVLTAVTWRHGNTTMARVRYTSDTNGDRILVDGVDITNVVDGAFSGIEINTCPTMPPCEFGRLADVRHLLALCKTTFHHTDLSDDGTRDREEAYFGHSQLIASPKLIEAATKGPVRLAHEIRIHTDLTIPLSEDGWKRLGRIERERAEEYLANRKLINADGTMEKATRELVAERHEQALADTGYTRVRDSAVLRQGEYRLRPRAIEIYHRLAKYPHSVLLQRRGATHLEYSVYVGESGKSGVDLFTLQRHLHDAQVESCFILEDGADLRCHILGTDLVPAKRDRLKAIVAIEYPEDQVLRADASVSLCR